MQKTILTITTLFLLLTFVGVLFVSVTVLNHEGTGHGSGCPFMNHEESICPMSVLDHLSVLRNIFEFTVPGLAIALFYAPALLIFYSFLPETRPPTKLKTYTKLKRRASELNNYLYRLHQELFARGILNPKLF